MTHTSSPCLFSFQDPPRHGRHGPGRRAGLLHPHSKSRASVRGETAARKTHGETLAVVISLVQICLGWWRYGYGAAHHGREAEAEDLRRCPVGSRLFSCSGTC
ncbi:hypothetical protein VPH35_106591 [Triticum aestivum]